LAAKVGDVELEFRPDRTAIVQGTQDPAVTVWFSLRPAATESHAGLPSTVVVLLDCSGTVRRFRLDDEEAKRWIQIGLERSEVRAVQSDQRTVFQVTGHTLEEVRESARSALWIAAAALEKVAASLREDDICCLVGFATKASILYDGRRRLGRHTLQGVLRAIQQDPSFPGLGDGTNMQEAARIAGTLLKADPGMRRVRRLLIITDGIVHDQPEALRELEQIRSERIAVSTIGVGQEFDEEFLTRVADWTGGSYHYAPKPEDIESRLAEDFGSLHLLAARDVTVSARGLEGAVVASVTQITPQMRMFEEIRLNEDWVQVDLGEVSGAAGMSLIGEFSLPWLGVGKHSVGEVQLEWQDPETGERHKSDHMVQIDCLPADSPGPPVDLEVEEMFMRLQVYRAERSAQWAQESGRPGIATVRLREASGILRRLGERDLAQRFEQQASDLEAQQANSDRTKTLKDWVRRLGQHKKEQRE